MPSFKTKIVATAVLVVLLAPFPAAGDGACAGVEVRSGSLIFGDGFESGDLSAWGGPDPSFPATLILDLDFEVRFVEDLSGDHVLHLKLLTPRGHHYQTLSVPIAGDPAQAGTVRPVEGYPRPLEVRVTTPVAGRAGETAVAQQFPVAGTAIVASALYGRWTATAYLDDQTEPCGPARGFVLTP